eukprot:scaffold17759_cov101-Isochrysis_galbana.AAC.1
MRLGALRCSCSSTSSTRTAFASTRTVRLEGLGCCARVGRVSSFRRRPPTASMAPCAAAHTCR